MRIVIDKQRGCGWRKPGGLYLMSEGILAPCGRLPLDLNRCPCCGSGIKATRGWTWVNARLLFKDHPCQGTTKKAAKAACTLCLLGNPPEKAGLLWIGGAYYARPEDWISEAQVQGVSRRIHSVPKGLEIGKTLVLVAHRAHHLAFDQLTKVPAIFHAFIPQRIEYVVKGNEPQVVLDRLVKRGIEPVSVIREGHLGSIDAEAQAASASLKKGKQ